MLQKFFQSFIFNCLCSFIINTSMLDLWARYVNIILHLLWSEKPIMARFCRFWRLCVAGAGSVGGTTPPEHAMLPNMSTPGVGACRWDEESTIQTTNSKYTITSNDGGLVKVAYKLLKKSTCKEVHWLDNLGFDWLLREVGGSFSPERSISNTTKPENLISLI